MATKLVTLLATGMVAAITSVQAATLPGSNFSMKIASTYACEQMDCSGTGSGKFSAVHRFDLDPAEAAQIDSKTSVTVNVLGTVIPLIMSDDPKFVDGATIAHIKRTVAVDSFVVGTANVSATLVWGDGVFTAYVKGTFSGASLLGPALAVKSPKDITQINLETKLENAGALINKTQVNLENTNSLNFYNVNEASGDSRYRGKYTVRSIE